MIWRLTAEQAYITGFYDAKEKQDTVSLRVLQGLRAELDQLIQFNVEDQAALLAELDEEMNDNDMDDYDMDDEDINWNEDNDAVSENQEEVAVAMMDLAMDENVDAKSTGTSVRVAPTLDTIPSA